MIIKFLATLLGLGIVNCGGYLDGNDNSSLHSFHNEGPKDSAPQGTFEFWVPMGDCTVSPMSARELRAATNPPLIREELASGEAEELRFQEIMEEEFQSHCDTGPQPANYRCTLGAGASYGGGSGLEIYHFNPCRSERVCHLTHSERNEHTEDITYPSSRDAPNGFSTDVGGLMEICERQWAEEEAAQD